VALVKSSTSILTSILTVIEIPRSGAYASVKTGAGD
jgi:hypothetical protein